MDSYMIPFTIRDALLCLVFLVGILAGIFAITRNHRKVGMLVITGFLLLGIDPASEFVIFNLISPTFAGATDPTFFNWTYACLSGLIDVAGFLTLMAAVYFAIQPEGKETHISSKHGV